VIPICPELDVVSQVASVFRIEVFQEYELVGLVAVPPFVAVLCEEPRIGVPSIP